MDNLQYRVNPLSVFGFTYALTRRRYYVYKTTSVIFYILLTICGLALIGVHIPGIQPSTDKAEIAGFTLLFLSFRYLAMLRIAASGTRLAPDEKTAILPPLSTWQRVVSLMLAVISVLCAVLFAASILSPDAMKNGVSVAQIAIESLLIGGAILFFSEWRNR